MARGKKPAAKGNGNGANLGFEATLWAAGSAPCAFSARQHGYPPDKQEKATQTVLEQAEMLCADWAG
jgi:hypothetical protein